METSFFLSFNDFKVYCESIKDKVSCVDGQCGACLQRKKCFFDNKECQINSLLHMKATESRFPKLLKYLQKEPDILYAIPSILYKRLYGLYHQNFECPFNNNIIINNIVNIEKAYNLLDKESQMIFLNILLYRLTQNRDYIYRAYSMEPQYFISLFCNLDSDEVYVDCGAYNGDTFLNYCRYNAVPKAAYLFEPDKKNYNNLKVFSQKYNDVCKLHIIDKAVYKFTGNLNFVEGKGLCSHLTAMPTENSIPLAVTSIDDTIFEDVSFIKMDIEGFEKEALLGGEKHIISAYPKLAVSIYHHISDLWEIPLFIADMFPRYNNFIIRQHTKYNQETVLYAF